MGARIAWVRCATMFEERPDRRPVLASDSERERVALLLRDAAGEGRLTLEELAGRLDSTYAARTSQELEVVTRDLPTQPAAAGIDVASETSSVVAVMSGAKRSGRWRLGKRCRAIAVMGGCKLDLRSAELTAQDPVIRAVSIMGGIDIIIPEGIAVEVTGLALMGGKSVRIKDVPPVPGAPRLRVRVLALMGGVSVRSKAAKRGERIASPPPPLQTAHPLASLEQVAASVETERPNLSAAAAPDGTVTLLFSDLEGSTDLIERLGDSQWLELLQTHHRLVRRQVEAYGGFVVKVQGDGFMVAFPGVRRAVQCARAIQDAMSAEFHRHPEGPIRVRIGLHTGEVLKEEDDFYGKNVVLAARIAEQARGGEILASAVVKELAESVGDIRFDDAQEVELKGLAGTYRMFRVS
jgi:class 3 adenylate cyclase